MQLIIQQQVTKIQRVHKEANYYLKSIFHIAHKHTLVPLNCF